MIPCRHDTSERSAALVIALSLIAVLSIMVVSLTLTMQVERRAAHYYVEQERAELLAREGIEYVKAAVRKATTSPDAQWISMPGRIVSATNGLQNAQAFNLFSAAVATAEADAANLNRRILSDDSRTALTGSDNAPGEEMKVGWIYVRQNGEREITPNPDPSNPDNPIIGRFAYWADDETARINLNTAWKNQGNTNSLNHPTHVNLTVTGITAAEADEIHDTVQTTAFNSPAEARRLNAGLADVLSTNRFSLSHYTRSPNQNPWGEPKIVLTTKKANLPPELRNRPDAANFYLSILKDETVDPGYGTSHTDKNLNQTQYAHNLNKIMSYLARTNWPYGTGSFIDKYGYANSVQIAANIIEYVRAAESAYPTPIADRFTLPSTPDPGNDTFDFGSVTSDRTLRANSRNVMLTEVAVWMNGTKTSKGGYHTQAKVELYLPPYPGVEPIELDGVMFTLVLSAPGTADERVNADAGKIWLNDDNTETQPNDLKLRPGTYATITLTNLSYTIKTKETAPPSEAGARMILFLPGVTQISDYRIWDIAPLSKSAPRIRTPVTIDSGASPTWTRSAQVNDPRVNKFGTNWYQADSTFLAANAEWAAAVPVPAGEPPQDRDGAAISQDSLTQPALKGSPLNPHGAVRSVAELGFIHSGIAANVPWRTLRFQPTPGATAATLPDWALLDLFTVPLVPSDRPALVAQMTGAAAGRVNINSGIVPFTNITRFVPLSALFAGSSTISSSAFANILDRTYAANGVNYGGDLGFVSPGELAEIKDVADAGESSERRLQGAVDLATVQSDVYRVHSLGQAIQQTPSGQLVIQAERYLVAIVERNEQGVRTVYWKTLLQ